MGEASGNFSEKPVCSPNLLPTPVHENAMQRKSSIPDAVASNVHLGSIVMPMLLNSFINDPENRMA